MTTRRLDPSTGRPFGSVRQLPSGRWQARYRPRGRSAVRAPHTFDTEADAFAWLNSVQDAKEAGRIPHLNADAQQPLDSTTKTSAFAPGSTPGPRS